MLKAFKRKILSFFIGYSGKYLLRAILFTCRIEIKGLESFKQTIISEKCILMLWHNRLSLVSEILYKLRLDTVFSALISKSRDGDPLAVLSNSYPTGKAIRVAHNLKSQALKAVIDTLKETDEVIIMTPDGPRGPRYEVKPGIVLAAKEAHAAIIAFSWVSTQFWQLKSWDRLLFPKPFSKIIVTFGQPIHLNNENDPQELLKTHLLTMEAEVNKNLFANETLWPK